MKNLMIDAETLATTGLPIFIQLGACVFDDETGEIGADFEMCISIDSCVGLGAIIDDGAFDFWMKQPPEAQRAVRNKPQHMTAALGHLNMFYETRGVERVWSQGLGFDIAHLERYYDRISLPVPWRYSAPRDTRTLYEVAQRYANWERPPRIVAHTALADARAQAQDCLGAMMALRALSPFTK